MVKTKMARSLPPKKRISEGNEKKETRGRGRPRSSSSSKGNISKNDVKSNIDVKVKRLSWDTTKGVENNRSFVAQSSGVEFEKDKSTYIRGREAFWLLNDDLILTVQQKLKDSGKLSQHSVEINEMPISAVEQQTFSSGNDSCGQSSEAESIPECPSPPYIRRKSAINARKKWTKELKDEKAASKLEKFFAFYDYDAFCDDDSTSWMEALSDHLGGETHSSKNNLQEIDKQNTEVQPKAVTESNESCFLLDKVDTGDVLRDVVENEGVSQQQEKTRKDSVTPEDSPHNLDSVIGRSDLAETVACEAENEREIETRIEDEAAYEMEMEREAESCGNDIQTDEITERLNHQTESETAQTDISKSNDENTDSSKASELQLSVIEPGTGSVSEKEANDLPPSLMVIDTPAEMGLPSANNERLNSSAQDTQQETNGESFQKKDGGNSGSNGISSAEVGAIIQKTDLSPVRSSADVYAGGCDITPRTGNTGCQKNKLQNTYRSIVEILNKPTKKQVVETSPREVLKRKCKQTFTVTKSKKHDSPASVAQAKVTDIFRGKSPSSQYETVNSAFCLKAGNTGMANIEISPEIESAASVLTMMSAGGGRSFARSHTAFVGNKEREKEQWNSDTTWKIQQEMRTDLPPKSGIYVCELCGLEFLEATLLLNHVGQHGKDSERGRNQCKLISESGKTLVMVSNSSQGLPGQHGKDSERGGNQCKSISDSGKTLVMVSNSTQGLPGQHGKDSERGGNQCKSILESGKALAMVSNSSQGLPGQHGKDTEPGGNKYKLISQSGKALVMVSNSSQGLPGQHGKDSERDGNQCKSISQSGKALAMVPNSSQDLPQLSSSVAQFNEKPSQLGVPGSVSRGFGTTNDRGNVFPETEMEPSNSNLVQSLVADGDALKSTELEHDGNEGPSGSTENRVLMESDKTYAASAKGPREIRNLELDNSAGRNNTVEHLSTERRPLTSGSSNVILLAVEKSSKLNTESVSNKPGKNLNPTVKATEQGRQNLSVCEPDDEVQMQPSIVLDAAELRAQLSDLLSDTDSEAESQLSDINAVNAKSERSNNPLVTGTQCITLVQPKSSSENTNSNVSNASTPPSFACTLCTRVFSSIANMRRHIRFQHNSHRPHKCHVCGKGFPYPSSLEEHMNMHSVAPSKTHVCDMCGKAFVRASGLRKHVKEHHNKLRPYICHVCKKDFIYLCALREHLRSHSNDRTFKCKECDCIFKHASNLLAHAKRHHKDVCKCPEGKCTCRPKVMIPVRFVKCSICLETFNGKKQLGIHMRVHSDNKPFVCEFCLKSFPSRFLLTKHRVKHEEMKTYACEVCSRSFVSKQSMKIHMSSHDEKKMFQCDSCGKKYATKNSLKIHSALHLESRPHECQVCGKKFANLANLSKHHTTHTRTHAFICGHCHKQFPTQTDLKKHLVHHDEQKTFPCSFCGKKFLHKSNLNMHIVKHTGEKPYSCDVCGRCFSIKANLRRHALLHSRENGHIFSGSSIPTPGAFVVLGPE